MKRGFYALIVFCLVFSYKVSAQYHNNNRGCGDNGFSTEVVKAELKDNGCIDYKLKVTFEKSKCAHPLSRYVVAVSCGKISKATNSKNWTMEYGQDKKSGLTGLIVKNIPDFGKTSLQSFTVSFRVCLEGNNKCSTEEGCCYPIVAYRTDNDCIFYDKLKNSCPAPQPPPAVELKASLTKTDITCFGAKNGSLSVKITEGKEPYTYKWSTGATTQSISNLPSGSYEVIVKDANGKELTLKGTVTEPAKIEIAGVITNESCGGKNASVDLTVTGGSGKYTFLWSNGAMTEDLNSLSAGEYSVTVKDEKGCEENSSFTITNHTSLTLTSSTVMAGCGKANGAIDITVSGGTEPYTYQWSNGATTQDLQNIGPGTYRVTVKDSNGCTDETALVIKENNTLKLTHAVTQTSCLDDASGAIDLIVTGGTAPYTYVWSNNATTQDIAGLISGLYSVTVTDAAGCTSTVRISVTNKSFQVSEQVVQPACGSSQGGSVMLTPVNGVAPYVYVWSNGATGNSISGLTPGIYTVIVTDATGCSRDLAYVISDPTGITSSVTITNDQCNAQGHFNIDITVSSGQAPYTYQWSNGATTEDLTNVQTGNYSVTITDANGCSTVKEIQVAGSPTWSCLINQPASEITCSSTGNVLNTSVAGADSYSWTIESSDGQWALTGGSTSSSITYNAGGANSSATIKLTIVKDGCTQTCEYKVNTCKDQTTPPEDPDDNGGDDGDDDNGDDGGNDDDNAPVCKAYPNPFKEKLCFEWKADRDEDACIEIFDSRGHHVKDVFRGRVNKGEHYKVECADLDGQMYIYRFRSGKKTTHGKICKSR